VSMDAWPIDQRSIRMVKKIKQSVKKSFKHFGYFYSHLGYRVFISFSLSFLVGILDGFGLTMFFPLLETVGGGKSDAGAGMGGLSFLVDGIESLGIGLNIYSILIIIILFFLLKGVVR